MSINTRNYTVTASATLVTETCGQCGVLFAMPAHLQDQLLDDRSRSFWCPNGHQRHYVGKTQAQQEKERADRLARQLEAARAQAVHDRDQREATERSNRALRAVNTRTRKRIAAGVCPCCSRSFSDLAQHMAGQHPEYAGSDT